MKRVRTTENHFVFAMGRREKRLLLDLLQRYPAVPPTHHRVTKPGAPIAGDAQQLLDESLAEQRAANRRGIEAMLERPDRFTLIENGTFYELTLSSAEMEWLLQVLNDIRIGSWIRLGCPGPDSPEPEDKESAAGRFAMEASGYFESALLAAFEPDDEE